MSLIYNPERQLTIKDGIHAFWKNYKNKLSFHLPHEKKTWFNKSTWQHLGFSVNINY